MLTERHVKRDKVSFLPAIWSGKNTSGCDPVGDRVLIKPDLVLDKIGAIHMTDDQTEREQMAVCSGVIVAIGDDAFSWNSDRTRPFGGYKPRVGDRVYFEKYAGQPVTGDDNAQYRIIDDKQIGAVIEKVKG